MHVTLGRANASDPPRHQRDSKTGWTYQRGLPSPLGDGEGRRACDDDVAGRRVGAIWHPTKCIGPGLIPTEFAWEVRKLTDESAAGATRAEQIPLERLGTDEEFANLTIFATSDACKYLTGETIVMAGGQRLAGVNTLAALSAMTDEDWAAARHRGEAASAAASADRTCDAYIRQRS